MSVSEGYNTNDVPSNKIYINDKVEVAVEIKGGIDPAGVHERFGAALKSLRKAKQENQNAITILIIKDFSLTHTAKKEIEDEAIIDHFLTTGDLIRNEEASNYLFEIMRI